MNNFIKFHLDNDFIIQLEKIEQINAVKLTLPECHIYEDFNISKSYKLYESFNNELIIYKNSSRYETFNVDSPAHRSILILDVLYTCKKYNINSDLIILYENNEPKQFGFNNIRKANLFNITETTKELEIALLMNKLISNEKYDHILNKYSLSKELEIFKRIIELGGL